MMDTFLVIGSQISYIEAVTGMVYIHQEITHGDLVLYHPGGAIQKTRLPGSGEEFIRTSPRSGVQHTRWQQQFVNHCIKKSSPDPV